MSDPIDIPLNKATDKIRIPGYAKKRIQVKNKELEMMVLMDKSKKLKKAVYLFMPWFMEMSPSLEKECFYEMLKAIGHRINEIDDKIEVIRHYYEFQTDSELIL